MKKRIISMLLAIVMVAGMLPMPVHVHAAEGTTAPDPVCNCGTDDESIHATTCAVYVAPETAVCYCAEKCTEVNEWCDVCGFDVTACGGGEEAVPFVTNPTGKGWLPYTGSAQVLINDTPADTGYKWGYFAYGYGAEPVFILPAEWEPPARTDVDCYYVHCIHIPDTLTGFEELINYCGDNDILLMVYIYPVVTTAPVGATGLTANGSAQSLISAEGVPAGGYGPDMLYSVTSGSATSPGSFSTALPTATEPGTYKVWYKARAQSTTAWGTKRITIDTPDSEAKYITVTIGDEVVSQITWIVEGETYATTSQTVSKKLTLPATPEKASVNCTSYIFGGWFTAAQGGEQVTEETVFSANTGATYYGRFTEVNTHNPALASYGTNGFCPNGCYMPATDSNSDGIYEIANGGQLFWFAKQINSGALARNTGAILTADIDLENRAWTPICSTAIYNNTTYYVDKGYEGTFDGNCHVIKNLSVTGSATKIASFGLIGTLSGTVKTLGFENFTYTGAGKDSRVGTIVGQLIGGTVDDCYAVGININTQVGTTNGVAGGLVGANYAGNLYFCYTSDVTISAGRFGGVVGDCCGDIGTDDRSGSALGCWTDAAQVTGTQIGSESYFLLCNANASAALASGEAVWSFNLSSSEGVWKQTLGTDAHPNFTGKTVYKVKKCDGTTDAYSNTNAQLDHVYENGKCTVCGADCPQHTNFTNGICTFCGSYQSAELVDGVYQIGNLGQLMWFAQNVKTAHKALLTADITIDNSVVWTPIALQDGTANSSTFNGGGHTITFANTNAGSTFGLFSKYNYSIIENLYLAGSITCNTTDNVGVLVNSAYRTTIRNVISTCDITNSATSGGTGGLAGQFGGQNSGDLYSLIENCAVYADVKGGGSAGGFIGNIWGGNQYCTVRNCAYVGDVAGSVNSGAIVGTNGNNSSTTSTFSNVYFCETDGIGWIGSAGSSTPSLTNVEAKDAEVFASGEVACLLQGEQETHVWGQTIGTDPSPVLGGQKVYAVQNCIGNAYSNTNESGSHNYVNGFCIVCDAYEPAILNGDVYEISNAGQLYWFAQQVNAGNTAINGKLMKDIVVNTALMDKITIAADGTATVNESEFLRAWTPIGNTSKKYTGTFDGGGKTVSGLYFNKAGTNFVGLFGNVGAGGKVKNVSVDNSYLRGNRYVAAVVGRNTDGTIEKCSNSAIITGNEYVGGIVGYNSTKSMTACVTACYNSGAITGNNWIGGIVGGNFGTVTNCYNTATVSGNTSVGGVTGSNTEIISNCHNTGTVTASTNTGGVTGINSGTVTNCYFNWDNYSGDGIGSDSGTAANVESRTTEQFASGEVAYLLSQGENGDVWGQKIGTDPYPVFSNDVVIKQEDGTYANVPSAAGTLGDLDLDGDVDAYDLTALARHVGGIEMVEGQPLLNADVDGDGDVDAYDLTKHARRVGGIITSWDQE